VAGGCHQVLPRALLPRVHIHGACSWLPVGCKPKVQKGWQGSNAPPPPPAAPRRPRVEASPEAGRRPAQHGPRHTCLSRLLHPLYTVSVRGLQTVWRAHSSHGRLRSRGPALPREEGTGACEPSHLRPKAGARAALGKGRRQWQGANWPAPAASHGHVARGRAMEAAADGRRCAHKLRTDAPLACGLGA
jgi:hypothetical protein